MALTDDIIKKQDQLKGLTDEQITSIVELSVNDEQSVIDERIGRIYGDLDKDIKETFAVDKQQGEKTYNYLKRAGQHVLQQVQESAEYKGKAETLEQKIADLEAKIKDGKGNEAVAQQLRDAQTKLEALTTKYENDLKTVKEQLTAKEIEAQNLRVDFEFDRVFAGKKYKPEVTEGMRTLLEGTAREKVKAEYQADFIDDGKGGKRMVFRDKDGNIQYNPENKLHPVTAEELITRELKEVFLAEQKTGTGTGKHGRPAEAIVLGEAKTQVEADKQIVTHLLSKGMVKGTEQFADEQKKLRGELGVEKLPIQ